LSVDLEEQISPQGRHEWETTNARLRRPKNGLQAMLPKLIQSSLKYDAVRTRNLARGPLPQELPEQAAAEQRIYRLGANPEAEWLPQARRQQTQTLAAASSVLAPGAALRSVPTVALSSAQAEHDFTRILRPRRLRGSDQRCTQRESFSAGLDATVMGDAF